MPLDHRPLFAWTRDVALAYAGGLVLGAPFALTAVWLTGLERIATVCLLLAMALVFLALRRRSPGQSDDDTVHSGSHEARANNRPARGRRVA